MTGADSPKQAQLASAPVRRAFGPGTADQPGVGGHQRGAGKRCEGAEQSSEKRQRDTENELAPRVQAQQPFAPERGGHAKLGPSGEVVGAAELADGARDHDRGEDERGGGDESGRHETILLRRPVYTLWRVP